MWVGPIEIFHYKPSLLSTCMPIDDTCEYALVSLHRTLKELAEEKEHTSKIKNQKSLSDF